MRVPITPEVAKWLDINAKPWKPKDDAPQEIKKKIEEYLRKIEELEKRNRYR